MEAAIRDQFPEANVELIRGAGGVFDVTRDGELLFSKHSTGRFPEPQEVLDQLREPQPTG